MGGCPFVSSERSFVTRSPGCTAVAILGMFTMLSGAPATRADEAISLTWNACPVDAGAAHDISFACADNVTPHALHVSFTLATPVDKVVGAEMVVDLQSATPTLPDWWKVGTGGCRAGALTGSLSFGETACTDPWNGLGSVSFPS